ncbi:MAG: ribose-phosphate diphosphokinase [Patescibacteria group bacterium]
MGYETDLRIGVIPPALLSSALISRDWSERIKPHINELRTIENEFVLLAGTGNTRLGNTVAQLLGQPLHYSVQRFSGGYQDEPEVVGRVPPGSSHKQAIIIQSTGAPVNTSLMELCVMCDAAKRTGAEDIMVVVPYLAYSRQDRKDQSGASITARLVADILQTAGANRIVTCDLHAEQETGFYNIPVDHLYASLVLIPHLKELIERHNLRFKGGAPDGGADKKVRAYARRIDGGDIVTFQKERDVIKGGKSHIVGCQGDIEGYDLMLIDDQLAGGATLDESAEYALAHGAKSVRGIITHGLFLGRDKKSPTQILNESPLKEIIATDTIDIPDEIRNHPKVTVVSIAPLLAEVIYRNLVGKPLADLVT